MSTVTVTRTPTALGLSLPADVPHGVSVSLPTWEDNIGYERGDSRVMDKLTSGYPRFYIQLPVQRLQAVCERKFGLPHERCHIFPSLRIAEACRAFMHAHSPDTSHPVLVRIAQFLIQAPSSPTSLSPTSSAKDSSIELHIVFFPTDSAPLAKQFWQHTGNGISSRMAERCLSLLPSQDVPSAHITLGHGTDSPPTAAGAWNKSRNRHYAGLKKGGHTTSASPEVASLSSGKDEVTDDVADYLEERYGRNLPISAASLAKRALRRRVAGVMVHDEIPLSDSEVRRGPCVTEDDVYFYPTGMSAIWHSHQLVLATLPPAKSVCFGFPYLDTYKILLKWGPGCHFFGHGLESDIDVLTELLVSSPSTPPILALYCEFPSNPLLRSPNLARLRKLADDYGFIIVVDETIGSFANVEVLPFADIIVSSLTKVFSGETNVMGGSLVLNPLSRHYHALKEKMTATYEDLYWMEDAIYLERNSRDFAPRVHKINQNSEALCGFLRSKSLAYRQRQGEDVKSDDEVSIVMKEVYYPKWITPENYEACRLGSPTQAPQSKAVSSERNGGYGGLFSVTFTSELASATFFDALRCEKGPSLGTNFTLACPYTILAHYTELEWAAGYGVETGLVRVSVGLEDESVLIAWFSEALNKAEDAIRRVGARA